MLPEMICTLVDMVSILHTHQYELAMPQKAKVASICFEHGPKRPSQICSHDDEAGTSRHGHSSVRSLGHVISMS